MTNNIDGFITLPDEEPGVSQFISIGLNEYGNGIPIDNSVMGDMYHIALFRGDTMQFDETFEAILTHPETYAKQLLPHFYGVFVRKTDKTEEWFKEYISDILIKVLKLREEMLTENKT